MRSGAGWMRPLPTRPSISAADWVRRSAAFEWATSGRPLTAAALFYCAALLSIEFFIVDPRRICLPDRQRLAIPGDLFRIDRDSSVSIVRSFDRVRIDEFICNLARIASRGWMRLSIESDRMDFGTRCLIFLADRSASADETASRCGHVDDHLALLWIVEGLLQIDFPDSEEWFALFILRYQARAKREHCNQHDGRLPGHFTLP